MGVTGDSRKAPYRVIRADLDDPHHQQALLAMVRSFSLEVSGEDLPRARQTALVDGLRAHPAALAFVAFADADPAGFSICFLGFSTFQVRPLINIHDFYVAADHRRRGVGRKMLEAIEAEARALDCCKLTLEVEENNNIAQGLYHGFGFAEARYSAEAGTVLFRQKVL